MKRYLMTSAMATALLLSACGSSTSHQNNIEQGWRYLLDPSLSQWEVWMGVPHDSVKGLPAHVLTANNLNQHGDPSDALGLNRDLKQVFQVVEQQGEPVLHISGEIYGGLTTLADFENFHLSMQVKWGEKKWAPRLNVKRDSGVLFHCQGEHGAFWKVWKACQEMQIQESDFGDYIPLAGPSGVIRSNDPENEPTYNPNGKLLRKVGGYSHAYTDTEFAHGQWNQVDLYAVNDEAIFVVNGTIAMRIEQSRDGKGKPLTSGQLQIQSEGAEIFYKDMKIKSINRFPAQM